MTCSCRCCQQWLCISGSCGAVIHILLLRCWQGMAMLAGSACTHGIGAWP